MKSELEFLHASKLPRLISKCDALSFYDLLEGFFPVSVDVSRHAEEIRDELASKEIDLKSLFSEKSYFHLLSNFTERDLEGVIILLSDRIDAELCNKYMKAMNYNFTSSSDAKLIEALRKNKFVAEAAASQIRKNRGSSDGRRSFIPKEYNTVLEFVKN
ncbi:hypothetical protein [Maritimibacter sp. 55A14]|uniref:hypothetical protein n=1 Tax=Maritimibacter sp. 55A14 TaxID=2174844 RepID=UPI0011B2639F|nr:hypothetical protein [Maritimibacter sp. 55A14]